VHFLDPVDRRTAADLIRDADVSVVALADEPLFAVTMPSKVQTGLASGKPLLVIAHGDAAAVVEEAAAGASAAPGDVASIVAAIQSLASLPTAELQAMGTRGRQLYRSQMARAVGLVRLSEILTDASRRG